MGVIHRGTVEVELLARYGNVPVGTRAKGKIVLSEVRDEYFQYKRVFQIRVGKDPRPFGWTTFFGWNETEGKPHRWGRMFRGKGISFTTTGFLEYVTQDLTCDIEDDSTSRGNQQFRVVSIEWTAAKPKRGKLAKKRT